MTTTPESTPAWAADRAATSRWASVRWLVLVPFAAVVVVMLGAEAPLRAPAVEWSLVSFAAAVALVSRLAGPAVRTLWAWIVLGLFLLGYLLQSALALSLGGDPTALARGIGSDMTWVTPAIVVDALVRIGRAAVVAFLTATVALEIVARAGTAPARSPDRVEPRYVWRLIAACAVASLVLAFLRFVLDIGVLGRETVHLPWRFDTVIFRSQSHLLPALFLYALWAAERAGRSRLAIAAGAAFFGHQVVVSLLSTSKSGLVWFALPVLFLWLCDRGLTRRRLAFVGAVLAAVIVGYPVVTALRQARVQTPGVQSAGDVAHTVAHLLATQPPTVMAQETARRLIVRVNGAAGVWFTLSAAAREGGLDRLWPDRRVPLIRYYTRDICGVTRPGDFRQPGLVAAFLLAGGPYDVWLWVVFVGGWAFAWWAAGRMWTAPVARALMAVHMLVFANEGTLSWPDLATAACCVLLIEGIHRRLAAGPANSPELA
jgi:hypothetical protein